MCAGIDIGTDQAQQQTEHDHADRVQQRAARQNQRGKEAQHHQREELRRSELERDLSKRRGKQGKDHRRHGSGKEGADGRRRQRHPGASLARHLVAVEGGDHGGRLARHIDQNRRGRTAVLRTIVDTGQHDQCGNRRQGEGDRQQHGDGCCRAQARQDADQRAEKDAGQTVEQIHRRHRRRQADSEIGQEFHGLCGEE